MNLKEKLKKSVSGEERRKNLRYGFLFICGDSHCHPAGRSSQSGSGTASRLRHGAGRQLQKKLYSIGDETKELVGNLEKDVELYYIVTGGNENDLISKLVDRYGELSLSSYG